MSEDLDLEANNLCIPEDAFEKFQAVSMYQEKEIIILPQKMPLNSKPPAPGKSCPVSSVNEVVSSSGNATISPVNSTQIASFQERKLNSSRVESSVSSVDNSLVNSKNISNYENDTDMVVSNSENVKDDTLASVTPITKAVPRKRGRKPKKPLVPMEESTTEIPKNIQNSDISSTPFSSDPETSDIVPSVRKKRGRPKKVWSGETSDMNRNNSDLSNDLSSSDNNKSFELSDKPIRRGRPKGSGRKAVTDIVSSGIETQPNLENEINNTHPEVKEVSSEPLSSTSNEKSKRRKRRTESSTAKTDLCVTEVQPDSNNKILSDGFSEDDLDDVCLSKLKNTPCQTSMGVLAQDKTVVDDKPDVDLKDGNSESIDEQIHKPKKRRGRPKKSITEQSQVYEKADQIPDNTLVKDKDHLEDSDADDMCLSKLRKVSEPSTNVTNVEVHNASEIHTDDQISNQVDETSEANKTPTKRNTKMPVMADFEYNIDSVIGNDNTDANNQGASSTLPVEDTSKRPMRRKTKALKYDEGSDEDPFANVELSDDEPRRGRRGNKYYSDDEYIPGKRGNTATESTDTEMSDNLQLELEDDTRHKRKKYRKKSDTQSPRKRGKKDDDSKPVVTTDGTVVEPTQTTGQADDVEGSLEPSVIKAGDDSQPPQPSQLWGTTTEFENFLAKKIQGTNLKIKKVSSNAPAETSKIEIPILDPEAKKTIEMCSQTTAVPTASVAVQTSTPNDIPLKENIPLTPEQSEKACFFLNSIVKTTAELGSLMKQKSEDFIKKKINTNHVTDTAKMDYCVKKSFLLFKLAKHNLLQMEEDLAKQYDEFLTNHNLTRCREEPKKVLPTPKESNSDSDCEIVEVKPSPNIKPSQKAQAKPAFNPKTVFLNKELSIKIAKKPSEINKKLDIKGRHTVWINDTVMVKKVKPTQSFLAQDSRNKKPPDNRITTEMVSDFFKDYYRQKALSACAPFVSPEWLTMNKECVCNYFVVKPLDIKTDANYSDHDTTVSEPSHSISDIMTLAKNTVVTSPESLFKLCFRIVKLHIYADDFKEGTHKKRHELADRKSIPVTLFRLCMRTLIDCTTNKMEICPASPIQKSSSKDIQVNPLTLKTLCHKRIVELLEDSSYSNMRGEKESNIDINYYSEESSNSWLYNSEEKESSSKDIQVNPSTLKTLCHKRIVELLEDSSYSNMRGEKESNIDINYYSEESSNSWLNNSEETVLLPEHKNDVKSLFSLCVEHIQRTQLVLERNNNSVLSPKSLKNIAYENIKYLLYGNDFYETLLQHNDDDTAIEGLMINCVNTLSEEAFLNLEECNSDIADSSEYLDDFNNEDNFEPDIPEGEDDQIEPSWVSQVQMQELRSCVNINNLDVNGQQELEPIITQIKLEPLDDIADNLIESTQVKAEPGPGPDEMTIIPDVKAEIEDHNIHAAPIQRQNSNSYDVDAFEQFVSSNKLMQALTDKETEEIYSQSSERIRRQHEPDYDEENAVDMLGLLVPHTYEPMNIQSAKGSLMESSSDESSKKVSNTTKRPTAKRSKGRPKKLEHKANNKEVPVPTPTVTKEKEKVTNNEVAILTRKMKERIRQEERKNGSSDSEDENITVRLRSREKKDTVDQTRDKSKSGLKETSNLVIDKSKSALKDVSDRIVDKSKLASKETSERNRDKSTTDTKNNQSLDKAEPAPKEAVYQTRDKTKQLVKETVDQPQEKSKPSSSSKAKSTEIQCNNVDSTDQLEDSVETFTGFTSIETNEMSNYEKYMKFVYEKVIPDKEDELVNDKKKTRKNEAAKDKNYESGGEPSEPPIICPNEPVELLECEPTMPIFDNDTEKVKPSKKKKINMRDEENSVPEETPTFIDRHGWHCYPIDLDDDKLCQDASIYLEKLPESFVQTYFHYQNIATEKDESDEEINRLTNLNTLNRATIIKDRKPQNASKREAKDEKPTAESGVEDDSRTVSAVDSDHYDELLPSDDEGPSVDDQIPPPVQRQTENALAKSSLMDDKDSDDEAAQEEGTIKIKKEPIENSGETKKPKPSTKKKSINPEEASDLMLTADKMMNKELTLLHAPVVMDAKVENPTKGPVTRHSKKSDKKSSPANHKTKMEEDSSSEEEKQWVSTKEKLLKRMGKKDCATADDAKRAKLVSEFIERREGNPDSRKSRSGGRSRRSAKKFLEREKQLRVLQRELFGEMSNDPTVSKRSVAAAWKGRRNIRKVLDKKSLARSTVIANMEEFERKKRLNGRQTRLRELLGCEEGVNVLVINDEVCLEYDFEEHRPVVTIHPFFTKVMKAHQYEGVKFMWDACFESLADMEAGHAGGGCILAHCMGLGKTLQVLALLHTVLTHPRVGMHRVLVCCPLSTVLNWVDEIHKWIGPVTNQIKVFELSKLKKTYERAYQLEDWYNGGGIFIIGYELFRSLSTIDPLLDDVRPTIVNKIRTALLDPGPDIIVCDEGHLLKNDCSVLAVAMSRVVTKRRIVLTGTPMQNNLREYYCMVNFVKPNLLGTYSEYSNRFENPIMNGQHRDSSEEDIKLMKARTHILHKVLEGCLQRQEASVLYPYLPKKHEYTVFINLTKSQWDLYKHYLNHYSRQMKQNSILKDFHILQKIWSHPQVLHNFQIKAQENRNKIKLEKLEDDLATEDQEDIKDSVATEMWWLQYLDGGDKLDSLDTSNKFVVVFRILDECVALGDKVLIFSTSLFCLDALEYFLKKINKWSLGQEYYRLDGSVPAEVRQKWCREFNAENNVNTKLFLVSTRAGCLGLNMTAANRVIIMDTSWNPAHDIQSIFRVYRFGQKKDCYIYRLVAMGTMEQKIYERAVTKQAVACRVVDEQQIDRHYNMAELTELYRYDEQGSSVASGVAVGVCDVALLRVARDVALHAVHEHDSLLRSSEQGLPEHERNAAWMQFQQEQTHKQMENKLIAKIPKLSLKRLQGNAYAKSLHLEDIKPEIKQEDTSEDFVPTPPPKLKRGRPRKVVPPKEVEPPVAEAWSAQPGSSKDEPMYARTYQAKHAKPGTSTDATRHYEEEMMVHKITELLIKYDFQNRKGNTDIASLVGKVRNIVKQGYIYKNEDSDDLTTSIAKVLLQKRMSLPVVTDIMCESINKTASPTTSQEPENILSTPVNEYVATQKLPDNKRKRKAALAAERHIDSITQDVIINLDEDLDPTDTDFVPHIVEKTDKTNKRKSSLKEAPIIDNTQRPQPTEDHRDRTEVSVQDNINASVQDSVPVIKPKPGPKTFKERLQKKFKQLTSKTMEEPVAEDSRSILLSDEEEVQRKTAPPANSAVASFSAMAAEEDDDEVVPLPLSLLTNKNFINIVAHTYLNGNPMLDADAATLAAQYSTFKSLKEAEQTGRDITSGPIYDIALKVIGKTLFRRMNTSTVQKSTSSVESANVTIELKEKMDQATDNKEEPTKTKKKKEKRPDKSTGQMSNVIEPTSNVYPNGNVVPVGLIKTARNLPSEEFASESILPDDDDDMHIVPHDVPARVQPTPVAAPRPATYQQEHNTTPPILDHVQTKKHTDTPPTATAVAKPSKKIKLTRGKIIQPTMVVSGSIPRVTEPPPTSHHILPTSRNDDATICLDSDEDETITPTPVAPPVPVMLSLRQAGTAEGATVVPVSSSLGVPQKPLILKQVASGAAPKFVLVPASTSSTSLRPTGQDYLRQLPKLLPKEFVPPPGASVKLLTTVPPESILPTSSPSVVGLSKVNQARCRPGDIIKISDRGEIEVLQVGQLNTLNTGPAQSPSETATINPAGEVLKPQSTGEIEKPKTTSNTNSKTTKSKTLGEGSNIKSSSSESKAKSSEPLKTKPAATAITKPKLSNSDTGNSTSGASVAAVERATSRTLSVSSSSSEESRPSSPDHNPLAILKNVVHIQAADDTPATPGTPGTSTNKTTTKKPAQCAYIEHVYPSDSKNSTNTTPAKKPDKESVLKPVKKVIKSTKDQLKTKDTPTASSSSNKLQKGEVSSKMLADLLNKKTTLSVKSTFDKKAGGSTSGVKAIVVDTKSVSSNNKNFKTVDLTQIATVKSGCGPTMLKTKIEAKKRVVPNETETLPKKKSKPMTLKDFDIDDIDDIIELD